MRREPGVSEQLDDHAIEVLSAEAPADAPDRVPEQPTIGGSAVPQPIQEEEIAAATDGSLAAHLRAVGERLQRTKTRDFDIPDTPIVLRARTFKDRRAYQQGIKTERFIIEATAGLFLRDEDTGELHEIPTWGPQLAAALGFPHDNAIQLVRRVFDNPVRLEVFAAELIEWMAGRQREDEQTLGE